MKVRVETVKTDRLVMDYCRFGSGGRSFVILPGISVQSVMPLADAIARQYKLLTDDYTMYVFDRRKDMPDTYTVRDMAHDTAEAMRALGIKRADIFGASQGGMMAIVMAADDPELAARIIIGSSCARIPAGEFGFFDECIRLAEAGRSEELYLIFGEAMYPQEVFEGARDQLKAAAATVSKEDLRRFIIMTEGMRELDLTDELGRISCPAFVIGSKDDRVVGADASAQIYDGLVSSSGRELYIYEGYGHAVYDLAPDYQERFMDFLKKHNK